MLLKPGRLGLFLIPFFVIGFLSLQYRQGEWTTLPALAKKAFAKDQAPLQGSSSSSTATSFPTDNHGSFDVPTTHRQISSLSTPDHQYFPISFGDWGAINPNIIPHPSLPETWIIVAQQERSNVVNTLWCAELVCNAAFDANHTLSCLKSPTTLPIAATTSAKCSGNLAFFGFNVGPHDARVFYGPNEPFVMYGSQSMHTCFGQWMQDFRLLYDWGADGYNPGAFRKATDLQRPDFYGPVEKNWFVFWDRQGKPYVHYDVAPKRAFAALEIDGAVGLDLAPLAAKSDEKCLAKYMPEVSEEKGVGSSAGSIHQATNSLSITFCKRADPSCKIDASNTFVFTIFQRKTEREFHSVYDPYVMVFQQQAPFAVHAISERPIWIRGRGVHEMPSREEGESAESRWERRQTQMFYVTSMSWATQGQKYHGYLDDKLFVAFGIEDERTAGIDVLAGDLLSDLGLCLEV